MHQPFCKNSLKKKKKKKNVFFFSRNLGVCLPAASRLSRVKISDGPQTSIRSTNTSLAAVLGGKFLTDGLKERWLRQTGRQGEKRGVGGVVWWRGGVRVVWCGVGCGAGGGGVWCGWCGVVAGVGCGWCGGGGGVRVRWEWGRVGLFLNL